MTEVHIDATVPLWPLYAYLLVGLLAYVPLVLWADTKISGHRTGLSKFTSRHGWEAARSVTVMAAASMVLWPWIVADVAGWTPAARRSRKSLARYQAERDRDRV